MSPTLRLVAVALACASCAIVQREKPGLSDSIEHEKALTADIHRQIRDNAPLVSDPVLLDLVYEVGDRIVAVTEPQPFIYRFFIIEDDSLNAFTIGGAISIFIRGRSRRSVTLPSWQDSWPTRSLTCASATSPGEARVRTSQR